MSIERKKIFYKIYLTNKEIVYLFILDIQFLYFCKSYYQIIKKICNLHNRVISGYKKVIYPLFMT